MTRSPLHYVEVGAGAEPVLLLHGFLGSGRNLGGLARQWSARDPAVRLIVADLTGHGHSPPLPPSPTLADVAHDVAALAMERGAREIVGHSFGGRAALLARRQSAGAIERVVLLDIAPGPFAGGSSAAALLAVLRAAPPRAADREAMAQALRAPAPEVGPGPGEAMVQWLLQGLDRDPDGGVHWRVDREQLARLHANAQQDASLDLWSTLADGPTRCIRGGASPFVSDLDARRMIDAGCRVDTLSGVGHYVHVDGLAELLDLLAGARRWS